MSRYPWTSVDNINLDWFVDQFFALSNFVKREVQDIEAMKRWVLKNVTAVDVKTELLKMIDLSIAEQTIIQSNLGITEELTAFRDNLEEIAQRSLENKEAISSLTSQLADYIQAIKFGTVRITPTEGQLLIPQSVLAQEITKIVFTDSQKQAFREHLDIWNVEGVEF